MSSTRTEHDSFGAIEVPAQRLWGAQTQRSLEHFDISGERLPRGLLLALARVKAAAAEVNQALGRLDAAKAGAIVQAAREVLDGHHDEEFPLVVWQTGSGTQTNMNMNEVLANRASVLLGGPVGSARLVHPNDEVNRGQSSNDVFPTAMNIAAVLAIERDLLPALQSLHDTLAAKAAAFADVMRPWRSSVKMPSSAFCQSSRYRTSLSRSAASARRRSLVSMAREIRSAIEPAKTCSSLRQRRARSPWSMHNAPTVRPRRRMAASSCAPMLSPAAGGVPESLRQIPTGPCASTKRRCSNAAKYAGLLATS